MKTAKLSEKEIWVLGKKLKENIDKYFEGSFTIKIIDSGSCNGCEYEISALSNPLYDLERYGIKFVAGARQADAIMITGCLTRNMKGAVINIYKTMREPKFVIAVGDCPVDGGVFKESYAVWDGIKDKLHVDLWIKGCPPEPNDTRLSLFSSLILYITGLERASNEIKN